MRAYPSPFLNPELDAPQPSTLSQPQPSTPIHQTVGATPESAVTYGINPIHQSLGDAMPLYRGPRSVPRDKDCAQILDGFASLIRLQADGYAQSIFFALICMLVPTVIAVTVAAYAVLRSQFFH